MFEEEGKGVLNCAASNLGWRYGIGVGVGVGLGVGRIVGTYTESCLLILWLILVQETFISDGH